MPANLENSAVAARPLDKVSFHTNPKERCREQGIRKVEKCLQTRLSTRAEHSCKRDVQLRILCSRGKRTFLAHKDVSLIPQKEQTQGQNGFQVDKEVPPNKVLAAVNKSR